MKTLPRHPALPVVALLLLAAVARLVGIGGIEPWYDERLSVKYLDQPTLGSFLEIVAQKNPAVPPLYFAIEYAWYHGVHDSIASLRVLSVLMSLAGLLLVWATGRLLYDEATGLLAMALLVLNPHHIYYSQSIRMYCLVFTLGIASFYLFFLAMRSGKRRYWFGQGVVNLLLVWSHPFAALAFVPQGLAVLHRWRLRWPALAWSAAHVFIAGSVALYVVMMRDTEEAARGLGWLSAPALLATGNNVPSIELWLLHWCGYRMVPPGTEWLWVNTDTRAWVVFHLVLFGALVMLAGVRDWRERERVAGRMPVLLVWAFVPALVLAAVSFAFMPAFHYRYFIFSLPAFAMLAAAGTLCMPGRWGKGIAAALVLLLLAAQYLNAVAIPLRPFYVMHS